jgi:hypothetical protein
LELHVPPPVPTTSIFSRSDGIVAWQSSVEDKRAHTESVEVWASHCGLGHNPAAVYVIADRLAQPEGRWAHFDRSGLRSLIYPDPWREGSPRLDRQASGHEAGSAKAGTNGKLEPSCTEASAAPTHRLKAGKEGVMTRSTPRRAVAARGMLTGAK